MLEIESARFVIGGFGAYLGLGLGAALLLVFVLGGRIDRGLPGSGLGFRLLILPGCILLWPLLVARCLRGTGTPPRERNAHRADRSS